MKLKSVVFTVALASAFSAFADSVDVYWFTTNDTSRVGYFYRAVDNPVVITNTVAVPTGWTIASYAITAHVTNLVVFASTPSATLKTFKDSLDNDMSARGAICAAYDDTTQGNKWYGLNYKNPGFEWVDLDGTVPNEEHDYKLRMDFTNGTGKVIYSVYDLTDSNQDVAGVWCDTIVSASPSSIPNLWAFAGMGCCTNVVGDIVISVAGRRAVPVEGGQILVDSGSAVTSENANTEADNRLKYWVNYVLGISESGTATADKKPYAAPVQNASATELSLKLGGVNVRGQNETGAKVTYTIEELDALSDESPVEKASDVDPAQTATFTLDSTGTKYYRIKIKIDPAH